MKISDWPKSDEISIWLIKDGWNSPNTYSNHWDEPGNFSAIYLFQLHDFATLQRGIVAYVGQSINLKARLSGHEILRSLDHPDIWVQKWFKRTPKPNLKSTELHYIQHFDPPWNIIGRTRGVSIDV